MSNKNQWVKRNLQIENEQIQRYNKNSISRERYISNREKWRSFLKQAIKNHSQDDLLVSEAKRIIDIVEYSSYFRDKNCMEELKEIEESKDFEYIKEILQQIK